MSDVARSKGAFSGDSRPKEPAAGALAAETVGVGSGMDGVADVGARVTGTRTVCLYRTLCRRTGLDPSSRFSHRRKASGEISTPRPRNAIASTSTESPSRRSRSSSSRCGSSCAVFGCFGWRTFATSSASVGGGVGAISWCAGGGVGVMWERYSERLCSAMGVVLDQSKPKGLDVGVPALCFILILACSHEDLDTLIAGSRKVAVVPSSRRLDLAESRSGVARSRRSSFSGRYSGGSEKGGSRC